MNPNTDKSPTQEIVANPVQPTVDSATSPVDYQDVVKSIHSAGTWATVLGVISIIAAPLLEVLIYKQDGTTGESKAMLVIVALVIGLITGGIFVGLGLKLKRTTADTIRQADRTLLWLAIALGIVMILSFVGGGHGAGLLNLLVLLQIAQARSKIKKIGKVQV